MRWLKPTYRIWNKVEPRGANDFAFVPANVSLPVDRKRRPNIVRTPFMVCNEACASFYRKAMVRPAITMLTIDMSLMRMLRLGPEVSLKGSPTVSPTTVAL